MNDPRPHCKDLLGDNCIDAIEPVMDYQPANKISDLLNGLWSRLTHTDHVKIYELIINDKISEGLSI